MPNPKDQPVTTYELLRGSKPKQDYAPRSTAMPPELTQRLAGSTAVDAANPIRIHRARTSGSRAYSPMTDNGFGSLLKFSKANPQAKVGLIGFDTEFFTLNGRQVPLQLGINATVMEYTQMTNERIMQATPTATYLTGIGAGDAKELRDMVGRIKNGRGSQADYETAKWLMTYRDLTVTSSKLGFATGASLNQIDKFRTMNAPMIMDHVADLDKAINNLASFQADPAEIRKHISGLVSGLGDLDAAAYVRANPGARDMGIFQDVLGVPIQSVLPKTRGGLFSLDPASIRRYTDPSVTQEIRDNTRYGYPGDPGNVYGVDSMRHRELSSRGLAVTKELHVAGDDARDAVQLAQFGMQKAMARPDSLESGAAYIGQTVIAEDAFRAIGADGQKSPFVQFQGVYSRKGWEQLQAGQTVYAQNFSQTPLSFAADDVMEIVDLRLTASQRADENLHRIVLRNTVTDSFHETVLLGPAFDEYMNKLRLSPTKQDIERARANSHLRLQGQARDVYGKMTGSAEGSWNQFNKNYGLFHDTLKKLSGSKEYAAKASDPAFLKTALNLVGGLETKGATAEHHNFAKAFTGLLGAGQKKLTWPQRQAMARLAPEFLSKQAVFDPILASGRGKLQNLKGGDYYNAVRQLDAALGLTIQGDSGFANLFQGTITEKDALIYDFKKTIGRLDLSTPDSILKGLSQHVRQSLPATSRKTTGDVIAQYKTLLPQLLREGLLTKDSAKELKKDLESATSGVGRATAGNFEKSIAEVVYQSFRENGVKEFDGQRQRIRAKPLQVSTGFTMNGQAVSPAIAQNVAQAFENTYSGLVQSGYGVAQGSYIQGLKGVLGNVESTRRDIAAKITDRLDNPNLAYGAGGVEAMLDNFKSGMGRRGVSIRGAYTTGPNKAGQVALDMVFGGDKLSFADASANAMSKIATINLPVLDPATGTVTFNGSSLANSGHFRYIKGQLHLRTAYDEMMAALDDDYFQGGLAKLMKDGNVDRAQGKINQLMNSTILSLSRYGDSDINQAYRSSSAGNALQTRLKRNKIGYRQLAEDYLQQVGGDVRYNSMDHDLFASYLLHNDDQLGKIVNATGLSANGMKRQRDLAGYALDLRGIMRTTLGTDAADKLLKFGFVRADQTAESYLKGYGPETMSLFGTTAIATRSAHLQNFNTTGLSADDKVFDFKSGRMLPAGGRGQLLGTDRFRLGIATSGMMDAYSANTGGVTKPWITPTGQVSNARGVNAQAVFLDQATARELFHPDVIKAVNAKHNNLLAAAMTPTIHDSAAIYTSDLAEGLQTAMPRTLRLDPGQAGKMAKKLGKSLEDPEGWVGKVVDPNGDTAGLMRWMRTKAGYKGSHASVITSAVFDANGALKLGFNEMTIADKTALSEGEKSTGILMSQRTLGLVAEEAAAQQRIDPALARAIGRADIVLNQESKTASGMSSSVLQEYARRELASGAKTADQILDDLASKLGQVEFEGSDGLRYKMAGPLTDKEIRKAITMVNNTIVIDNTKVLRHNPGAVALAKALDLDNLFFRRNGKVVAMAGQVNVGVVPLHDFGGVSQARINLSSLEMRQTIASDLFAGQKEDYALAQKLWIDPIQAELHRKAQSPAIRQEYQAVRSDLSSLLTSGAKPGLADNVLLTRQFTDDYLAAQPGRQAGTVDRLDSAITKRFGNSGLGLKTMTEEEVVQSKYMLGLQKGQSAWLELPEAVRMEGLGPVSFLKYTATEVAKDDYDDLSPDTRQKALGRMVDIIDNFTTIDPKLKIDSEAYQRQMRSALWDFGRESHNAVQDRKGFIANKFLTTVDRNSLNLFASPMSEMLDKTSAARIMGGEAVQVQMSDLVASQGYNGKPVDAVITSHAARDWLQTQYDDLPEADVERLISRMRGGYVADMSRSPNKDQATIGLVRMRVLSETEEDAMVRGIANSESAADMQKARVMFKEKYKSRVFLSDPLAKTMKGDYDADFFAMRVMGLDKYDEVNKTLTFNDGQVRDYERLAGRFTQYREDLINKMYKGSQDKGQDVIIGKNAIDSIANMSLLDQSESELAERAAAYATVSKNSVGLLAKRGEGNVHGGLRLAHAAARQLDDTAATAAIVDHSAVLNTYASAIQEVGIGGKKFLEEQAGTAMLDDAAQETLLAQFTHLTGKLETNRINQDELGLLSNIFDQIGFTENGVFKPNDRFGVIAAERLQRGMTLADTQKSFQFLEPFTKKAGSANLARSHWYAGEEGAAAVKKSRDALAMAGPAESNAASLIGDVMEQAAVPTDIDDLTRLFKSQMYTSDLIKDASAEFSSRAGKYAPETIGGLGNILRNPNLGRIGVAAGAGLAGLMLLGAATAPKIDHTKDRSAVDRRMAADGDWLNAENFDAAPDGAAPNMGLPRAMLTANDRGYSSLKINVRGRASGQSGADMIKLLENEINRQVPVNFNFQYTANDSREHMDQSWLSQKMAEAFNSGRARA
jgi:hypothetical protein